MYYLDTNICIYALKGQYSNIQNRLSSLRPSKIKISAIVKAELFFGAVRSNNKTKTLSAIKSFIKPFEVVSFCDECSESYAQIRSDLESSGRLVGPNDLILASTVLAKNGVLITHNTKEFSRIKELKIEDWCL